MLPQTLGLLLPLVLARTTRAAGLATCYMLNGEVDAEMRPCDPSAEVSTCCRPTDLCLSNGLCLGGGGNNGYSQQGCTSSSWDSPCHIYCSKSITSFQDGFQYLQQCSSFDPTGVNPFCCGGDFECCNNNTNIIQGLPKFTAVSRAGVTAPTSTGPVSAATVTVTVTSTAAADGADNSKVVAVGAGVGASLGAALIGVVGLLIWTMRKHRKQYSEAGSHQPTSPHQYREHPQYTGQPLYTEQSKHAAAELHSPKPQSPLTELSATPAT